MADQEVHAAPTLTEMMRRRAALTPDAPYFYLYGDTITYGRLWEVSGRYAAGLARGGLRAGDKLCLIYPTCAEFFFTFFGALRIGVVPVPLYPTLGVEATARILNDSETGAVATIGWFRKGVDESAAQAPGVRAILEPSDLDADAAAPAYAEPDAEDLAFLQYTSGSTGHPHGVMLTHRNVVSTIKFMAEAAGLTAEDRVVSWLPLYHDMGLIGFAFTPPLTRTPLRLLPPDLRNPRHGLAEATLAVAIWPRAVPLQFDPSGRFLSVGQPCPGVAVRVLAPDGVGEVPLAPAEEGEIYVQSPGVMRGYYNNAEDTRKVLSPDGWLRTGDLGFLDKDGFLYVTGRLKDLIILAGENVPPADVEEVVDLVDGVRYSAAVGIESERAGTQRLHVVAEVRSESASPDEYHGLVREIVSRVHKQRGHRPARVLLVRAGTVPKTSSGKIQRSRLVEMIQRGELHDRIVYGTTERTVPRPPTG